MIGKYIRQQRLALGYSEQEVAQKAGISRLTLRAIESGRGNPTVQTLQQVRASFGKKLEYLAYPEEQSVSDVSTVAVSMKILNENEESWPIHLMEMVDCFRKTFDLRLLLLPPVFGLKKKIEALMGSTVLFLCNESQLDAPEWATKLIFLEQPWFPSDMENLKAMAILESPWEFRRNNIFVLNNFLERK